MTASFSYHGEIDGSRPVLVDLFCGAGGAAMGYYRAGFDVVGVDHRPQPHYPFTFVWKDALEFLDSLLAGGVFEWDLSSFVAVHASPPCQFASDLRHLWKDREHPNLIPPTRERLARLGLPYVIENVERARRHLVEPVMLCGSMFGLGANGRQLRRHRVFEVTFPIMRSVCQHRGQPVGVYGHGGGGSMTRGYKGSGSEYRESMDIHWGATKAEIAQAIPPAYTEHIGHYLMAEVDRRAQAVAA